jgi:hypothetical protein
MVDPERLELPTPAFEAQCSIQLSYGSNDSLLNEFYCTAATIGYGLARVRRSPADLNPERKSPYPRAISRATVG